MSDTRPSKRRQRDVETIPSATAKPVERRKPAAAEPAPTQPEPVEPEAVEPETIEPEAIEQAIETAAEPAPEPPPEPAQRSADSTQPSAEPTQPSAELPSVEATLVRADSYWRAFRALADQFPLQRIDEPLTREWTRKQMLAHVSAWHDLTAERLLAFAKSGAEQPLAVGVDAFNARVARAAVGRTSGEVLGSLNASFKRLRRQVAQLTDEQLRAHEGWALRVIASNTYDHYDQHAGDLQADLSSSR